MTISVDNMPNLASINVEGLATAYAAGSHIDTHRHDAHQIVHSISGAMRVRASDAVWIVPPGRGLWVPAFVEHEIWCSNRVDMRTVYISGSHPAQRSTLQVIGVSALLRELMVRFTDGPEDWQVPHLTALLIGEAAAMKVEQLTLAAPKDARIDALCRKLLANPADNRSLDDWAGALGLSPRSLMRHIRSDLGMSFRSVRRQVRIMVAIERLSMGRSVTSVALDVGFESPSAFAFAFRSVTGMTPSDYLG